MRQLDSIAALSPDEFRLAVGMGLVPKYRLYRKFGNNLDVDIGTEDVWTNGGTRTLPPTAAVVSCVSTSAEDGAGTSTGILTMTIEGLNDSHEEISETITVNGTDAVVTTALFYRVNRMYGVTAGSTHAAVGTITATVGANVQATIDPLHGQTRQALYTVPAGHTFYITSVVAGSGRVGAGDVTFDVFTTVGEFTSTAVWRAIGTQSIYEVSFDEGDLSGAVVCPEKSEIRMTATSTLVNMVISGSFHGFLVAD